MMKNILITGISGGIGEAVAKNLLIYGSTVIGVDRVISENISELQKKFPDNTRFMEADLMNSDVVKGLVGSLVDEYGPIGGFIHCAGFDKMLPIHLTKAEDMERLWRIHAFVPMLMISAISKKKNHLENTSIVLISSQSAHEGAMGHTAYAAAKGAIEGYLAPAAAELMEKGIRINEVCLGPVKTPMSEEWMSKLTTDGMTKLMNNYPLGIGNVEDVSNLICFLLSKESRWINGQIIVADGGHSVRKI